MFLNRATRALPEYSQQHERERTNMGESRRYTKLKWEKKYRNALQGAYYRDTTNSTI